MPQLWPEKDKKRKKKKTQSELVKDDPTLVEFYLQEPYHILMVNNGEKSLMFLVREVEKQPLRYVRTFSS